MRTFLFGCLVAASWSFRPPAVIAQPPASSEAPDAQAFFRLGEYYEANIWPSYFAAAGKLDERYAAFEADCKRLGAPAEVLSDLDAAIKVRRAMPFLTRPYGTWTAEENKTWAETTAFHEDVWKAWLDKPDYGPRFFWHLGRVSFCSWFVVGPTCWSAESRRRLTRRPPATSRATRRPC